MQAQREAKRPLRDYVRGWWGKNLRVYPSFRKCTENWGIQATIHNCGKNILKLNIHQELKENPKSCGAVASSDKNRGTSLGLSRDLSRRKTNRKWPIGDNKWRDQNGQTKQQSNQEIALELAPTTHKDVPNQISGDSDNYNYVYEAKCLQNSGSKWSKFLVVFSRSKTRMKRFLSCRRMQSDVARSTGCRDLHGIFNRTCFFFLSKPVETMEGGRRRQLWSGITRQWCYELAWNLGIFQRKLKWWSNNCNKLIW